MNCAEVDKLLADYSACNLAGRTEKTVKEHLDACTDCASELDKLTSVMAMVQDELTDIDPPVGLWNGVYNEIAAQRSGTRRAWLPGLFVQPRRVFGLAVAGLALAGGLFFVVPRHQTSPDTSLPETAAVEYVQNHAFAASQDAFADHASLGFVASMSQTKERGEL